jgi:transcriptional regulator with XRE-family HTH domain
MKLPMKACDLLRQTRKQLGLTQPEAAERCGVSFSAYEKWERGASLMPPVLAGLLLLLDAPAETARAAARELIALDKTNYPVAGERPSR